jgi:hypothetical protein
MLDNPNFLEFAVGRMESCSDCNIFVANNRGEGKASLRMPISSSFLEAIVGDEYLEKYFVHDLRPAYGSTLIRRDLINVREYESLFPSPCSSNFLGIEPDDGFAGLLLLAPNSKVLVSGIVGSIQGVTPGSLSRSAFWQKTSSLNIAVTYLNLYQLKHASRSQKKAVIESVLNRFQISALTWQLFWYFRKSPVLIGVILISRFRARFPKRKKRNKPNFKEPRSSYSL